MKFADAIGRIVPGVARHSRRSENAERKRSGKSWGGGRASEREKYVNFILLEKQGARILARDIACRKDREKEEIRWKRGKRKRSKEEGAIGTQRDGGRGADGGYRDETRGGEKRDSVCK